MLQIIIKPQNWCKIGIQTWRFHLRPKDDQIPKLENLKVQFDKIYYILGKKQIDLKFYRFDKTHEYKHIDFLFSDAVDWKLIETHWNDMLQVILSIKAG
ncbi:transposase [Clostridium estertheticum]|nr:Tn3 family transposase [Clostridium estertheticum]MBU3198390.1 transposase [Clostridium estertheticum]WAG65073.1 transposase [Clostridium estertheticum]